MEKATRLRLNLKKCCLIPLWRGLSCHVEATIREQVCACAPRWLQIPIASSVVFLGYLFGPGATEPDIWHDALEKCIWACGDHCGQWCVPNSRL